MEIQIKYPLSEGFYFKVSGEVLVQDFEGHPFHTEAYIQQVFFCDRNPPGLLVPVEKINATVSAKMRAQMIHEAQKIACRTQKNLSPSMEPMPLRRNGSASTGSKYGGTTKPAKMLQS